MKYLLTHFQDEIKPVLHKIVLEKSEHIIFSLPFLSL